jgi:hypothetical protein
MISPMSYRWWVFAHLAGVFGLLASHGVSMAVALRLRKERDPARIEGLIELSGRSIVPMYVSLGVLLGSGIVATSLGRLWSFGWIWAAIATLLIVSLVMSFVARPYYRRVAFVARALAGGSEAVTPEQFDALLRSRRPFAMTWIGFVGLGLILYLMMFKPTLGLAPGLPARAATARPAITVRAVNGRFTAGRLIAPAAAFRLELRNDDPGVLHNLAIYAGPFAADALFVGTTFPGRATRTYEVPSLPPGRYFFRCDVHPTIMTGTLVVG